MSADISIHRKFPGRYYARAESTKAIDWMDQLYERLEENKLYSFSELNIGTIDKAVYYFGTDYDLLCAVRSASEYGGLAIRELRWHPFVQWKNRDLNWILKVLPMALDAKTKFNEAWNAHVKV